MLNSGLRTMRATLFGLGLIALSTEAGAQPAPEAGGTACHTAELASVADRLAAAFDVHPFVFLGSTHGGVKRHEFLLCLLSRPAFLDHATDIVVEFASGAHQGLLDRYLIELEPLPVTELRPLALDTDRPELWATLPQVPAFFEAVRRVNEGLPRHERIRVIGGSEAIRWPEVRASGDLAPFPFKTNWTAHLIVEHLAPDPERRVLVVYGDGHIKHGNGTLMSNLEAELDPHGLFVVGTLIDLDPEERDLVAAFGDPDRPFFLPAEAFPAVERLPDDLVPMVADSGRPDPGDLPHAVDALVYLGPEPDRSLVGRIPLSAAERDEVERRRRFKTRETVTLRYEARDRWFEGHPRDVPPDPRQGDVEP